MSQTAFIYAGHDLLSSTACGAGIPARVRVRPRFILGTEWAMMFKLP
jgi:hypothetical protein